jgi:hypothetical protein
MRQFRHDSEGWDRSPQPALYCVPVKKLLRGKVQVMVRDFPPQWIPPGSPADRVPPAPPGTIFAVGPEGGFAAPPRRYTLLFGRERENVHVPVGVSDPVVSRTHGVFACVGEGGEWWLRNTGRLPIELPGGALVLTDHQRRMQPGYTPLVISSSPRRSHLLEVRVVGYDGPQPHTVTSASTADPTTVYELSPPERLVLTALAMRYLEGDDQHPQPLTWKRTAQIARQSPHSTKCWTKPNVEHTVEAVRGRLRTRHGVAGLTRGEVGENVGTTLNGNLIRELIRTATLTPQDLALLGERD